MEHPARRDGVRIAVEGVSVRFRVPRERYGTFKEYTIRRLQRRVVHEDHWALRDVSLTLRPGEFFGVIGRNGAGKSTLLRVIARVLRPTSGRVRIWGRVAPLLEVGAGFHPELTGRENVFLNGTLLGRTRKEIDQAFDDILAFSELREFIDAPLRTYSSGMVSRLGFAVATAWPPEILLVDETLAVGDEPFQQKCLDRIASFRTNGTALVLVSHDLSVVEAQCERAIWIDQGRVCSRGSAPEVAQAYRQSQI